MEGAKLISISSLLNRRRPTTGAAYLRPPPPPPSTPPPPSATVDSKILNPSSVKVLKPLSEPSILVGTLSLPNLIDPTTSHSCFSFSDGRDHSSVCCDVLDFELRMIGRSIRVLAWNFVPFKQCGGVLEVIEWSFCENLVDESVFPLVCSGGDGSFERFEKDRYRVRGVLESVSPVASMPCTVGGEANARNVNCFVVEVLSCDCKHCCSSFDRSVRGDERHEFSRSNFVYFSGTTACWHPAISKLIGDVISLSRLRKKLVYVGEEEAQLMLVTTNVSCLHYSRLKSEGLLRRKCRSGFEGNGDVGMYVGVVRGVYMQGMVVELDEEVWLLLTDQLLVLPHSARVGTIIRVKNVHVVKSNFPWRKVLILGTCCKTNLSIVSFSALETGCQLLPQSQSRLRKFIESLVFPARLWVLLVVQCLRRKFSGVFPEKEILGSKHKGGIVETYAVSLLPSTVFRSRHNLFMEFCKHALCSSDDNISYGSLILAVPFSNFFNNCDRMWIKCVLQTKDGLKILEDCNQVDNFFQESRLSGQPVRRMLSSKEIGVSLLGNLKISPVTGRLQYFDATSSIDAVVPDLPSAWNQKAIYEVIDYSLVLEGRPEMRGQTWICNEDLFSCGSMFRSVLPERKTDLAVYVHFTWSNVLIRDFPIHNCSIFEDTSMKLGHGTFHLLHLAHKFPMPLQFHGDLLKSDKFFAFGEAVLLPCNLTIPASDGAACPSSIPLEPVESCQSGFAFKRCKTDHASRSIEKVGLPDNCSYGIRSCGHSSNFLSLPHKRSVHSFREASPVQIPCKLTIRRTFGQCMCVSGILCFTLDDGSSDILRLARRQKLFLEFNSENLFKYKLLHIGGYYIMKHCAEKCFCNSIDIDSGTKVVINLETHLWSLSLHFDKVLLSYGLNQNQSPDSFAVRQHSSRHHLQQELLFHPCGAADHGSFYDVSLHSSANATSLRNLDMQAVKLAMLEAFTWSRYTCSICQPVGCENTVVSFFQSQGKYSGNHLPQGNLISVVGIVVTLHSGFCSIDGGSYNGVAVGDHLLRVSGGKDLICLHVLADGHMVQIDGYLNKHDYPIGLGPGADVIFHRILALGGQSRFMLMPVSVITVHSVTEHPSTVVHSNHSMPEETVASCSISGLIQCDVCKPTRFRCRVVAVHIVVLERNRNSNLDKLLSDVHCRKPIANIPLAGFILDDGSSQCCCWATGERAATFLRLHETMPEVAFQSSWWGLETSDTGKCCRTPDFFLDKILKRHGRLTVKNHGSIYETLCQDLQVSVGSDHIFGSQEEDLLKFIILNACSSTSWSVLGHAMDSNAINELEKYLLEEQMNLHALKNVWASEVCQVNTAVEARALYEGL